MYHTYLIVQAKFEDDLLCGSKQLMKKLCNSTGNIYAYL